MSRADSRDQILAPNKCRSQRTFQNATPEMRNTANQMKCGKTKQNGASYQGWGGGDCERIGERNKFELSVSI